VTTVFPEHGSNRIPWTSPWSNTLPIPNEQLRLPPGSAIPLHQSAIWGKSWLLPT